MINMRLAIAKLEKTENVGEMKSSIEYGGDRAYFKVVVEDYGEEA